MNEEINKINNIGGGYSLNERYDNLDGLRTIAAIGIILMHVMANVGYEISDNPVTRVIGTFGNFVQLFFMISAFGMCCGYYERVKNGKITLNAFYLKRYIKILPYFAILVLVDVAISHTLSSVYEGFADITLFYGFISPTNQISIIGVGWALGVIFAFYILFPFFVFMLWTKARAWVSLAITLIINVLCVIYFGTASCNIALWLCYFVIGGIIYLYREPIKRFIGKNIAIRIISLLVAIGLTVAWYFIPKKVGGFPLSTVTEGMMFAAWLMYAISVKSVILSNLVTKFISGISFEIYLAHMVIFRVIEKVGLTKLCGESTLSYVLSCVFTLIGVIAFAFIAKKAISAVEKAINKKIAERKEKQSAET